jgi:hypothetical protein
MHILPRHYYEKGTLFGMEFPGRWGKVLEEGLAKETIDPLTEMQIIKIIQEQTRNEVYPAIRSYRAEYIIYLLWDRFVKLCIDEGAVVENGDYDIEIPKKTLASGQEVGDIIICSCHCRNREALNADDTYCKFWIGPLSYSVQQDYGKHVPYLADLDTTDVCKFSSDTLKRVVSQDSEGLVYFYMHMDEYVQKVKQVLCHFNAVCKKMNRAIIEQTGSAYEC